MAEEVLGNDNFFLMNSYIIFNSHSNSTLESVLKKLKNVANTSFEKAVPLPAAANHSTEFYNQEQKKYLIMNGFALVERMKFLMAEITSHMR